MEELSSGLEVLSVASLPRLKHCSADASHPALMKRMRSVLASNPQLPPPFILFVKMSAELVERVARLGRAQLQELAVHRCEQAIPYIDHVTQSPPMRPIVARWGQRGLFANLIMLMEKIVFARALDTALEIRWDLMGAEEHASHRSSGAELLSELFEPICLQHSPSSESTQLDPMQSSNGKEDEPWSINPCFTPVLHGLIWNSSHLPAMRSIFASRAGPSTLRATSGVQHLVDETLRQGLMRHSGPLARMSRLHPPSTCRS